MLSLWDHSLSLTTPDEYLKNHVDSLDLDETVVAKTGDFVYVPNRLVHRFKPAENTLYLSLPLILKGPMAL